mgnify:CR=1|jgi:hypothetical protein
MASQDVVFYDVNLGIMINFNLPKANCSSNDTFNITLMAVSLNALFTIHKVEFCIIF